jgi:hypothetical protein
LVETDTKFKVQSQNHDQFPQHGESKIQSRTNRFTNEEGFKGDSYVKEIKHEESLNFDTQLLSAAGMVRSE